MAYNEVQRRATDKYKAKAYAQINFAMPKERKPIIQAAAKAKGLSVNAYLWSLVEEDVKKTAE